MSNVVDIFGIAIIAWLIVKHTRAIECLGDAVAVGILSFIMYGLMKAPIILIGWGCTWPVSQEPKAQIISGIVSILFWAWFFSYNPIGKIVAYARNNRNSEF